MPGWSRYDEASGEVVTGMYDRPFMVRGTPASHGLWDRQEDVTITSFPTKKEAEKWIRQNGADYICSYGGYTRLHIENWNE